MNDPWFIAYRGKWQLQIVPCSLKGWIAIVAYCVGVMLLSLAIIPVATKIWAWITWAVMLTASIFLFIKFTLAFSETVDVDELRRNLKKKK
jgi:hypothetical protein